MRFPCASALRVFGSLGLSLTLLACGGGSSTLQPAETAESMTSSEAAKPLRSTLTLEEAERIVREVRGPFAYPDVTNPLRQPKSLADVLAILQTDQIDLFAPGVEFAKKDGSPKAKVLEAQMEIAWGENQRIVAQLLDSLSGELREEVADLRELEAVGKLSAPDTDRVERLEALLEEEGPLVRALSKLAPSHLAKGRVLAEALVNETPSDYEGYRVLADYARIRSDWAKFDALVAEVEKRHPTSTGLLFLKGIEVAERSRDFKAASEFMRQALAKDPKFARAQVKLFLFADGMEAKMAEFQKLETLSPQHQVVVLVGPVLKEAFAARAERRKRQREGDWRMNRF